MKRVILLRLTAVAMGTILAHSALADVVNGDFGTGDFTGWTTSAAGDPYYTSVAATGPVNAASIGAYYDDTSLSAPPIFGFIQQTVPTVQGTNYALTFSYGELNANPSFGGPAPSCCYLDPANVTNSHDPSTNPWAQDNSLAALWNGNTVFSASDFLTSDPGNQNATTNPDDGLSVGDYFYDTVTVLVKGNGSPLTLEFDGRDFQQAVIVTDISLQDVPEPGSLALLASGVMGLIFLTSRRRTGTSPIA
jgi:hypothetical protein